MDLDDGHEIDKHNKEVLRPCHSKYMYDHLLQDLMECQDASLYLQVGKAEHNEEDYSICESGSCATGCEDCHLLDQQFSSARECHNHF
jgi:hypothetical protein